jgi:hypothetical protein
MEEEEIEGLVVLVTNQMREVGAAELADESNYLIRESETSEVRVLEPRERLVDMLKAFDRFLAIQDRQTYVNAFRIMNRALSEERAPKGAFVLPTPGSREVAPVDLSNAPDLSELRARVRNLAARLSDVGSEL